MSALHEQAMHHVYQQLSNRLLEHLTRAQRTALQLLIQRLTVAAGGIERISDFRLLAPFTGGVDSACTLAFLRAAQLSIASRTPGTFRLRVVIWHRQGLSSAALANIERCCAALFLQDDPRVELLTAGWPNPRPWSGRSVLPTVQGRPTAILLCGHLTAGDACATFGLAPYLELGSLFERAIEWGDGADAVAYPAFHRRHRAWLARIARESDADRGQPDRDFLPSALRTLQQLGREWHRELHGTEPDSFVPSAPVRPLGLIAVSDLMGQDIDECWPLLQRFLRYDPDDSVFICDDAYPAAALLIGHVRGLEGEYLDGATYADGLNAYLETMRARMRRRRLTAELIECMVGDTDTHRRRMAANSYLVETLQITEAQLVCMLHSPFVAQGKGVERFLRRCHPGMLVAHTDLHRALRGQVVPEQVKQWLMEVSGLDLEALMRLYTEPTAGIDASQGIIARTLAADPLRRRRMRAAHTG